MVSLKLNSAPPVARFLASIQPPWASMMALQIAKPKPVPLCAPSGLPRTNLSKISFSLPRGIPGPRSETETLKVKAALFRFQWKLA